MKRQNPRSRNQSGVALIVVLGFLSLLMVLAVPFLITARIEQEVSDYSLEAIRCRQLLRSGLAAALNDYSRELWSEKLYLPDEDYEVFVSEGSTGSQTIKATGTPLLCGEVSKVNNDLTDNYFLEPTARFPEVEEDEAALFPLCNEYGAL